MTNTFNLTLQRMGNLVGILLLGCLLAGCATATGPKFSGIVKPAADKGNVYLYRTDGLFAMGEAFTVTIDEQQIELLPNASYLHFTMSPGRHALKIKPTALGKTSELAIKVEAGKTQFYQYDFVSGPLGNMFFLGSAIEPRDEAAALAALRELQAAK